MKYRGFELEFYVIFSVDVNMDDYHITNPGYYAALPIELRGLMDLTENEDEDEYGIFDAAIHRKWVGELTEDLMDLLINRFDLYAQDVETMGSLTGFGILPAISFASPVYDNFTPQVADNEYIANAYVTPFINTAMLGDEHWDEIRQLVFDAWG